MSAATGVEPAVAALKAGKVAIVPSDTVYGLAALPHRPQPCHLLYRLKGREESQPTALVAADLEVLVDCLPELSGRAERIARTLLPGPFTLVLPNPARRYRWLTGTTPDAIGVRVPALDGAAAELLGCIGAVAATSANLPGGRDPRRLDDVPSELRERVDAVLDAGELPGTPSTVIDFTGDEPVVIREGAAPSEEALARVADALGADRPATR